MCTTFILKYKNGHLLGSNMDYGFNCTAKFVFLPRETELGENLNFHSPVSIITTQYAILGIKSYGRACLSNGMNEHGLIGSANYVPHAAPYPTEFDKTATYVGPSYMLLSFLLGSCRNIREVLIMLPKVRLIALTLIDFDIDIPLQYTFVGVDGQCITIEYINGWIIHDNRVGVMTNTPDYKWLKSIYDQYVKPDGFHINHIEFSELQRNLLEEGNQQHNIIEARDFYSVRRFLRTADYLNRLPKLDTPQDATVQCFQLLNALSIPYGLYFNKTNNYVEATVYSVCLNPADKNMYVRSANNLHIYHYHFSAFNLNDTEITEIYLSGPSNRNRISTKLF